MIKDFTRKRNVNLWGVFKKREVIRQNTNGLTDEQVDNMSYYVDYCCIFSNVLVDFIKLAELMIANDKEFEKWKRHVDDSKTLAEIKKELSVYQDKFDEINQKMRINAHIDAYVPICEYPSITF